VGPRGIELHAHFVDAGGIAHGRHDLLCGGRGRNVKGDDESLARIWLQTSLEGLLQTRYWAQNSDGLRLLHQVQADPLNAPVLQIEFPGSFVGQVDNAAVDHRTAIVDPDYERPAIAQVS